MNEELKKIEAQKNAAVHVTESTWNRGPSRFPSITKKISYEEDNWLFEIKYEVKISDSTKPTSYSNISDIHSVEIKAKSHYLNVPKFEILYRNKLTRFFFRGESKFKIFCKDESIKEILYKDKILDNFYNVVDLTTSGFEPYVIGLKHKEYFECKISFFVDEEPRMEFTESMKLMNYLKVLLEEQTQCKIEI